jgi:hypothetical protein
MYAEGSKAQGLENTRYFICEGECKEEDLDISCECVDEDNCDDDDHPRQMKQTDNVD